jgi:hypothetical protein
MKSTKDYLDISEFLIDKDLCVAKIKQGAATFMEQDLKHKISQNINLICSMQARNFFSHWYDSLGVVYLIDQVDPERVTEYIEKTRAPEINHDMLYALVCKKQQKLLNELYDELNNTNGVSYCIFMNSPFNKKKFEKMKKEYIELCKQRKNEHPKRIRSTKKFTDS